MGFKVEANTSFALRGGGGDQVKSTRRQWGSQRKKRENGGGGEGVGDEMGKWEKEGGAKRLVISSILALFTISTNSLFGRRRLVRLRPPGLSFSSYYI